MRTPTLLQACLLLVGWTASVASADSRGDCHVGVYRLPHGEVLDIAPADGDQLRWRKLDGTTGMLTAAERGEWTSTLGWTGRPDANRVTFAPCAAGTLEFNGERGRRIPLDVSETTFTRGDVTFAGRLLLPRGRGKVPIVVLVHGSEFDSARDWYSLQRQFPAAGIGAFVYDKRGTGASGGKYTQDFWTLADDAVAAMQEARRLAGRRAGRVGYQGGSQAGWVLPIAATRAPVDFVIVGFGLAVSVIDEDNEVIELEMRQKGHGPADIAKALEVAAAGHAVFESNLTTGFAQFDAVREKYRGESWYPDLHGNFTWLFLDKTEAQIREMAPKFDWHTPFRYDPMPTLRAVDVPQLWILGEADKDAPYAETARRLTQLIEAGRPITLVTFPGAEHGMTEFELSPDGKRRSTRYSAGYFDLMRDFARTGKTGKAYGRAHLTRRLTPP